MIAGDTLTVASATGAFSDSNAGADKTVVVSGITLGGADADNYILADDPVTDTASIFSLEVPFVATKAPFIMPEIDNTAKRLTLLSSSQLLNFTPELIQMGESVYYINEEDTSVNLIWEDF